MGCWITEERAIEGRAAAAMARRGEGIADEARELEQQKKEMRKSQICLFLNNWGRRSDMWDRPIESMTYRG
jgi:hypothetical protein